MNLIDFSVLLMVLVGPVSGFLAAREHNAGIVLATLFAIGGLASGLLVGFAASKCAYSALDSKRLNSVVAMLLYVAIPPVGLFAVALAPLLGVAIVYGSR